MKYRYIALFCIPLAISSARAIDIPMNRTLASDVLDSKTCYTTVKTRGNLVGFELNDLLVSSAGKLVELKAAGAYAPGKRVPRRYTGHGIEVTIVPQKVASHEDDNENISIVLEEGYAVIREDGRRKRIPVNVSNICTP